MLDVILQIMAAINPSMVGIKIQSLTTILPKRDPSSSDTNSNETYTYRTYPDRANSYAKNAHHNPAFEEDSPGSSAYSNLTFANSSLSSELSASSKVSFANTSPGSSENDQRVPVCEDSAIYPDVPPHWTEDDTAKQPALSGSDVTFANTSQGSTATDKVTNEYVAPDWTKFKISEQALSFGENENRNDSNAKVRRAKHIVAVLVLVCSLLGAIAFIAVYLKNITETPPPRQRLSECLSSKTIFRGDDLGVSCDLDIKLLAGATKVIVQDVNHYITTGHEPYFNIDSANSSIQTSENWTLEWIVRNDSVSITLLKQNVSCADDNVNVNIVITDGKNNTIEQGKQKILVTGRHTRETPNYIKLEDGLTGGQKDVVYETRIDDICNLQAIYVRAHAGSRGYVDMTMPCEKIDEDEGSHVCQLSLEREEFQRITKLEPNPESIISLQMEPVLPKDFTERVPCTTTKECEFNHPCIVSCGIRLTSLDRSLTIYKDNKSVGEANLDGFEIGIAEENRILVKGFDIVQGVFKFEMKYRYTSCADNGLYIFSFPSRNITVSVRVSGYINTADFILEKNGYGYFQGQDANISFQASVCSISCDSKNIHLNISGINATSTLVITSKDGRVCKVEWSQKLRQVGMDLNGVIIDAILSFNVGDTIRSIKRSTTLNIIEATFCSDSNKKAGCNYAHPYTEHWFISCVDNVNMYAQRCSEQNKFTSNVDCTGEC